MERVEESDEELEAVDWVAIFLMLILFYKVINFEPLHMFPAILKVELVFH